MRCARRLCGCIDGYYLYFEGRNAKCLTKEKISSSMYLLKEKNVYADENACRRTDVFAMHMMQDGGTRLCVTKQGCVEEGGFLFGQ